MKRITLSLAFLFIIIVVHAQWSTSGGLSTPPVTTGGNVGIGIPSPADQLEIVKGTRKVGINGSVSGVTSGLVSISRGDDGMKVMYLGASQAPKDDGVIFHQGGDSELRLVSAGGNSSGFGFYVNTDIVNAFASNRPIPVFKIDGNGNVGIGITAPDTKLAVAGDLKITGDLKMASGKIYWDWSNRTIEQYAPDASSTVIRFRNSMGVGQGNPNGGFDFADYSGNSVLRIINSNVGIGTISPGSFKLAVNGKIWGQEVQVAVNNPGPDYVFEKDYALPSLESVKTYIDQNKHLPEVPSAKEMEANGINLSEMNMLLLKKVEELTLYVIELKRESEIQKTKNESQEKEINALKRHNKY